MKKTTILAAAVAALLAAPMLSQAAVVQTTGAGSAVTTVDASADFESVNALSGLNYTENGLFFTRTGLNPNACGYAGCSGHTGFAGFAGNYMYGTGNGYFTMAAMGNNTFSGLEFAFGSGFGGSSSGGAWQAYNDGNLVGSGTFTGVFGSTVGFRDVAGFDELRYTGTFASFTAPAFDKVRAQYVSTQAVPEPASIALFGLGLAAFAGLRRRAPKAK